MSFHACSCRRLLADHLCDHRVSFESPFLWKVANVNYLRGPESSSQRLNPRHDCQEADPAHQIDRLCFWMVSGDGDSSRKTKHEHKESESDDGKKKATGRLRSPKSREKSPTVLP